MVDGHLVPNLLRVGLRVVFCGTAPGVTSVSQAAYYAYKHNRFWRTLHEVGLTPKQLEPSAYEELLNYGIGLTDLCKSHFGNDDQLPKDAFNIDDLRGVAVNYRPNIIAFTSKTAGKAFFGRAVEYGWQDSKIGQTRFYVLPSTSPRARSCRWC